MRRRARRLSRRLVDWREDSEVGAIARRARHVVGGVDAHTDEAEPEGTRVAGGQAARGQMHAVRAGGERDVGAVVDEERRREPVADPAKSARPLQELAGSDCRLPELHGRAATREHGQCGGDRLGRIGGRRSDQVQPDHAVPITPASGLEALP